MSQELECGCGHRIRLPADWQAPTTTCPNCGKVLAIAGGDIPTAEIQSCPVCGKKLLPHETWCTQCKASISDLRALRDDPHRAASSGLCPACGHKRLPQESACPSCGVVVKDYLEAYDLTPAEKKSTTCQTCGSRVLPHETACPKCKTKLPARE